MLEFIRDLLGFLKNRGKFWLAPIILTLLLFGVLIVVSEGSAIAPFIYTLFSLMFYCSARRKCQRLDSAAKIMSYRTGVVMK